MKKWKQWALLFGAPTVVVLIVQLLIVRIPLSAPLNADLANSFLATIAQVLAGILAIVFSVSVLALEISSDRYTPRSFSYFIVDPFTLLALISLLMCILISVIAMGIQTIPMYQWGFLFMSWFFGFCLLAMVYYSWQTLWLLDPRHLAERIRDDVERSVRSQNKQRFLDAITSLGDVAVKAFERGEDEIVGKYLDVLQEIQQTFITTGLAPAFIAGREFASALFGLGIPSPVVNEYYRIFKRIAEAKNERLTQHIARLLSEIIDTLTEQESSEQFLKGILVQQYREFIKIAIEKSNISRFSLVLSLRDTLFPGYQAIKEEYLPFCLVALQQANQAIIDHQDFDLWEEELGYFSSISSVEEVCQSLYVDFGILPGELLKAGISINREQWTRWHIVASSIDTQITSTNWRILELTLSEIEELILPSMQQLQEHAQRIRKTLLKLRVTTAVYDVFFQICVYALYREHYDYIKELWRHVNPPDASAHSANTDLIYFQVGFLTRQMMSYTLIPWQIEEFHGAEVYIHQYYLICLAYALWKTNGDWHPTIPSFIKTLLSQANNGYAVAIGQELRDKFTFLVDLPHRADQVLAQYATVDLMSKEWDDVFGNHASEAFTKARDWLADVTRRQEWTGKAESIIRDLPLDNSRVRAYQEAAVEHYRSRSQINRLAMVQSEQEGVPTELKGGCQIQCPDKRHFTLIALGKPEDVGRHVSFEGVEHIVRREINHIVDTLLKHKAVKPTKIKQLTFNKIAEATKKMHEAGYKATTLLAPQQWISAAWQDDPDFRTHMMSEANDRYLKLDENTKLHITEIKGDHVLILDRKVGNWTTVKPLEVDVTECGKNPLAVQIVTREVVDYQVLYPNAVKIFKFR